MNQIETLKKVRASVESLLYKKGYVAIVDVLLETGYLTNANYLSWRNGRVPYLEKVCSANLHKLSAICKEIRRYALSRGCKPSFTVYKGYGKNKRTLVFSKSGNPNIERSYATHYVLKRTEPNQTGGDDHAIEKKEELYGSKDQKASERAPG